MKLDRADEEKSSATGVFWLLLVVVLLGGSSGGAYWWKQNAALAVKTVAVRRVTTGNASTVLNATGYVTPRRLSTISSKVTGKITEVLIEEGMKVQQVLARLDTSNIDVNLRLAEAQLLVSQSALQETNVRRKEARLELERVTRLVREEIGTQSELDAATASHDAFGAQLARQGEEIKVAQRQIDLWV
ncbi:MAG: efflux RND transporter periplasmic adaptor subunit, partial [Verrucomicrobiia bacterium]